MKFFFLNVLLISLIVCTQAVCQDKPHRPSALENGKFFEMNGDEMLYGGEDTSQHFKINNLILEKDQFHYGLGREAFPALIDPEFISMEQADRIWADDSRFLVAHSGNEVKAYSIQDLTRHEVVNDQLNGKPIMAAYCILADLGAIYERSYGDEVLTFALSGYTYYDPEIWNGLDAFVMWDRETESLWWPLIGQAVSGPLKGVKMMVMDESKWEDTNWGTIKEKYPDVQVLRSGQDFERPKNWDQLNKEEVNEIVSKFEKED